MLYFILPMILVALAQWKVRSAFNKYSRIRSMAGITGAETARRILRENGIYDVGVEEVGGTLSDHYDPRDKVVRLSSDNFHGHHLAGLAVAAHEVGHAIQHATGYYALNLRHAILPAANLGSKLGFPLILAGMFFGATGLFKHRRPLSPPPCSSRSSRCPSSLMPARAPRPFSPAAATLPETKWAPRAKCSTPPP